MRLVFALLISVALQAPIVWAQDQPTSSQPTITQTNSDFERSLEFVRLIYTRPTSRRILNAAFKDLMVPGQTELTETQLIQFLIQHEDVRKEVKQYLIEIDAVESKHIDRVVEVINHYQSKLQFALDSGLQKRLIIRALRGDTPDAAITRFLQSKGVGAEEIKLTLEDMKKLKPILEADLKPIQDKYTQLFRSYLKDEAVVKQFQAYADPYGYVRVNAGKGPGYELTQVLANFPIVVDGKTIPAADLETDGYLKALDMVTDEGTLAVFDYDLMSVVKKINEISKKAKFLLAIDQGNYERRQEVKNAFDQTVGPKLIKTTVLTSALFHPKMLSINYQHAGKGWVYLSTGNCTQSCSGRGGDWPDLYPRAPKIRPNANMGWFIRSDGLASVVAHETKKAGDPNLRFKGKDYPKTQVYEFEGKDGALLRATFTPGGANGDVNKNLYARAMKGRKSKFRGGLTFAFNSDDVTNEVIEWALETLDRGEWPEAMFVGHRSFSMMGWSSQLKLSALKLIGTKAEGNQRYVDDTDSPLFKKMTTEQLAKWREQVRVAGKEFEDGKVTVDGVEYEYTVKQHIKMLMEFGSGTLENPKDCIVDIGSINISNNGLMNQEFALQFVNDPLMTKISAAVLFAHAKASQSSVFAEAERRNQFKLFEDPTDPTVDVDKPESRFKKGKNKAIPCNKLLGGGAEPTAA